MEAVEKIKAEADANGTDASQLLIDRLHPTDNLEAQEMLKVLNDGEEIFLHSDGTWDISVNKWDDAHKVSNVEYKKQMSARDEAAGGYAGDTAISHQDAAVKHTWVNRGWIGENEVLNKSNANKIAKNYKDKWQIDNKVKVEFVDGLKVKGEAVEGNTSATKYQGKTTKTKQNAIDKKKLQISKLEDAITMAEGGNKEVADPLDNLKEELRIAKNELKELEKAAKGTNKIPDITIQIDVNAKNPYATLRAELEHARDIAKGEVAPDYVYKKAQGKANALKGEAVDTHNINIKNQHLTYKHIDEGVNIGESYGVVRAVDNEGNIVGEISYIHNPENNTVHIADQAVKPQLQRQGIATDMVEIIKTKTGTNKVNANVLTEEGEKFLSGIESKGIIERYNTPSSQSFMKDGQTLDNGVKYNQETINESTRTNNNNIRRSDNNRTETSNDGLHGTRPSESDGGVRAFIRRSENGSSNAGGIIHDPSPEFKAELEAKGKPINSYKELAANSDEGAASFIANFKAANEINGKKSAQVYEYTPEEYKQMRLFTAENGKSGFALKPDGDIVSVFSTEKGSLAGLMKLAIQNGGNKLDCFDTYLPTIYKKFGFIEVDRVKWNEEYKPANWDKEFFKQWNNGEPDVVYMKLRQTPPAPIEPQQLKLDFSQAVETKTTTNDIVTGIVNGDVKPTTCSKLVEEGVPLPVVQALMNHKRISTTMRYNHLKNEQLENAVSVL